MSNLLKVYVEMPNEVKYSSTLYFTSVFIYNFWASYSSSKMYLDKFRKKSLEGGEVNRIKDEWSAVKYGASYNFYDRFISSFIWPITLSKDIVPWLVLTLNKAPPESIHPVSESEKKE